MKYKIKRGCKVSLYVWSIDRVAHLVWDGKYFVPYMGCKSIAIRFKGYPSRAVPLKSGKSMLCVMG